MQYLLTKEFSKINETSGATFDINYPVFYNATATSDGAAMSTGLYFAVGSVNLRTLTGDTERTFDAKKPLYLKGTLSGNIFTVHSDVITTSTPSTNDGFTYLRVGFTYSDYQAYVAVFCNELFAYKDGAFKKFDPFAEPYSLPTASASTKGGIKIGNGLSMIGDTLNVSLGGAVLDSTPSTVDGGLWYETTSTAPIIKFKQGGSTYYLYTNQLVSPNLTLSSSTVTATSGSSQTVTLTYSGEGTITLSNPNETALTATYDASTKTITLKSNLTSGSSVVNLGVNLSESGNYAADSQTLAVTCSAEPLDPQLTLSTNKTSLGKGASTTVTVSYLGTGTISVTSSTYAVIPFYNSSTKTITLQATNEPVMDYSVTITVSLSAAGAYASATATITNTDKAKPE